MITPVNNSASERNKKIAAVVLCVLALVALYFAFGRSLFGSGKTTAATPTPTPRTPSSSRSKPDNVNIPTQNEQDFVYQTTALNYRPGNFHAPDPKRNIFAFYEPPPPCPECPTPTPKPPPPATPTPTPEIFITVMMPQNVYAGSRSFRLELNGERFEPSARVYFSQSEMPTTFVSPQRITAEIPSNLISSEGPRQILVQTSDGKKYSNQMLLNVQAPPRPLFQYVGMIARRHANNDTAYFMEQGRPTPSGARLNDVVANRFRLVSISLDEVVLEDVNLGFRHRLPLFKPAPGTSSSPSPIRGGPGGYQPYSPNVPSFDGVPAGSIPGIPDNIPRYVPPANTNANRPVRPPRPVDDKKDVDDDEDGDN